MSKGDPAPKSCEKCPSGILVLVKRQPDPLTGGELLTYICNWCRTMTVIPIGRLPLQKPPPR